MADYTINIIVNCEDREVVHVMETFSPHDDVRALAGLQGWIKTVLHRTNWHVAAADTKARRSEE